MVQHLCYICNDKLTKENKYSEHVLLNALGGRLKSPNIICKDCNNKIGNKMDTELANQLKFFCIEFNIKRDRGVVQDILLEEESSGIKYRIDANGKQKIHKPEIQIKVEGNKKILNILTDSEKSLIKIVEGLKRKQFPEINIENILEQAKRSQKYVRYKAVETPIGGHLAFQSILKTALNYYILNGHSKDEIIHLIPYLLNNKEIDIVFVQNIKNNTLTEEEVSHSVFLKADQKNNLLYCYIEYFSFAGFIVLMNNNYQGLSFESVYSYDIINNRILNKPFTAHFSKEQINNILEHKSASIDLLVEKITAVHKVASKIKTKKWSTETSNRIIKEVISEYNSEILTKDMINTIVKRISIEYAKYAAHMISKDK